MNLSVSENTPLLGVVITSWLAVGVAILAGDALQALAFEVLAAPIAWEKGGKKVGGPKKLVNASKKAYLDAIHDKIGDGLLVADIERHDLDTLQRAQRILAAERLPWLGNADEHERSRPRHRRS